MNILKVYRNERGIISLFRTRPKYPEVKIAQKERIFTDHTLDLSRLAVVSLPSLHEYRRPRSCTDYISATQNREYLRVDKFVCAALLLHLNIWRKFIRSHGPFPNYTRFIFDGTIWQEATGVVFPAIAFIDGKYGPDLWPLSYCDDAAGVRRVIVQG